MKPAHSRTTVAIVVLALSTVFVGSLCGCNFGSAKPTPQPSAETLPVRSETPTPTTETANKKSPFHFEWMTAQSGIDMVYYGAPTRDAYMTEQNGGGVAMLDFDRDGQLDLFFANGSNFRQPAAGLSQSNRLYRSTGEFRYEDVTDTAGMLAHGFGMGVTAGDYDNDGFVDQFVACYGRDRLWHNNGDGTFTEVTDSAGVGCELWGTSAAMADLDGDGLLDLFVVNYVDWSPTEPPCHPADHPEINNVCSPMERSGQPNVLYRNRGDGRFEEIGSAAGVSRKDGKGLALAIADFDADRRLDIYVINDTTPKFLFRNLGEMRFEEVAVPWGVAISSNGTVGSGMGVGCADFDHNGRFDLCVTNFRNQVNDVYANMEYGGFEAVNTRLGIDSYSRSPLGFGIVLADFDLDTWPDMFVANGHIWDLTSIGAEYEYQMHPQLLWNHQGRQFSDVSATTGTYFTQRWLGRSVAYGDLDNDGDADLVVTHLGNPPAILRNDCVRSQESVRIEVIGTRSARQPLGATVTLVTRQQQRIVQVPAGGSFQASLDSRILGVTSATEPLEEVHVQWPEGQTEVWKRIHADRNGDLRLIEGTGQSLGAK